MKHLILSMLFFISSCGGGSSCNNDADGLITKNATVVYYGDPRFGGFYCNYIIDIENNYCHPTNFQFVKKIAFMTY